VRKNKDARPRPPRRLRRRLPLCEGEKPALPLPDGETRPKAARGWLVPLVFLLFLFLTAVTVLYGQRFRQRFVYPGDPPPTELVVARWQYTAFGKFGGTGWSHNYPSSDQHFAQVISEATNIDVKSLSYRIVELDSPDVFKYPFAVVSEPGEMALTDHEVENLRQFINRGGFVVMDDFDGPKDLATLRRDLHRAFPDRDLVPLTIDHEIFNVFYRIDALNIVSPYLVDGEPIFYALMRDNGTIAVIACYNNDLENFWDYIDRGEYPLKPSVEAFRLGINFLIYAMTH